MTVWKGFLPSDHEKILSRAPGNQSFSSKRELYFLLCNSILIGNDRKRFSLERPTGKKCYAFFARELGIVDSHKKESWSWIPLPGSKFKQLAKANEVWDLKIKHKINTNMLSPNTTYTAYLILSYESDCIGLDVRPADTRVKFGGTKFSGKALLCQDTELMELWSPVQIPRQREDGWMEIELGDFFNNGGDGKVKMALKDTDTSTPKCGFVIIGMEVRPKKNN
ncbi:hypothetical protein Sjap_007575 [Stephania japonica]|uniref:Uncharacterized protein n=1 Tax=Stephania japonica TaxID=461633 RepID=A0AAP0JNT4_9MAGN